MLKVGFGCVVSQEHKLCSRHEINDPKPIEVFDTEHYYSGRPFNGEYMWKNSNGPQVSPLVVALYPINLNKCPTFYHYVT